MFWGLKLDGVGVEASGGVGDRDWMSKFGIEDKRVGFGGAIFWDLGRTGGGLTTEGGGGGVNLGQSGTSS